MTGSDRMPGGALVTGGSRGIGRAIALELSRRGHPVVISARDKSMLQRTASDIEKATGNRVLRVVADASDRAAVAGLVTEAIAALGNLQILVNNAGATRMGGIAEVTDDMWHHGFGTKFFGAVAAMRAAVPHMISQGGGCIVNIAGLGGIQVLPMHMTGGAANIALVHLTKCVALQVGRYNIRVNAVSPGPIDTERFANSPDIAPDGPTTSLAAIERSLADVPLGRKGRPDEIAATVAFLTSPDASYISGAHIVVDGGKSRAL